MAARDEIERFKAQLTAHLANLRGDPVHPPGAEALVVHFMRVLDRVACGCANRHEVEQLLVAGDELHAWRHAQGDHRYDDLRDQWLAFMPALAATVPDQDNRDCPLGQRIRMARRALEWTQVQLAAKCGVHTSTEARWEAGTLAPTHHHRVLLAANLGGHPSDYEE